MTSSLTTGKLLILYMLDRTGGPVAMPRLSEFLLDQTLVNLLTLTRSYAELEESGLVRAENDTDRTFLCLTEEGEEALRLFYGQIDPALKEEADRFLRAYGTQLRDERDLRTDWHRVQGGCEVTLKASEKDVRLMEITVRLPDETSARAAAENLKKNSEEIYRYLIEKMF